MPCVMWNGEGRGAASARLSPTWSAAAPPVQSWAAGAPARPPLHHLLPASSSRPKLLPKTDSDPASENISCVCGQPCRVRAACWGWLRAPVPSRKRGGGVGHGCMWLLSLEQGGSPSASGGPPQIRSANQGGAADASLRMLSSCRRWCWYTAGLAQLGWRSRSHLAWGGGEGLAPPRPSTGDS